MNDSERRESGHLMLITPERVFYAGLLGRPRQRCPGAFHVYVVDRGRALADHRGWPRKLRRTGSSCRRTCGIPLRATIARRSASSSSRKAFARAPSKQLAERLSGAEADRHLRSASAPPTRAAASGSTATTSATPNSTPCALARRCHRVRSIRAWCKSIAQIGRFCGEPVTAASCAAEAGLSSSRFLHLFKQETGISFRAFRAWKRARHLLHFANQDINLAHLAQDIGYPDSTHFSHSIRRFYGLKPRAIFSGPGISRSTAAIPRARASLRQGRA